MNSMVTTNRKTSIFKKTKRKECNHTTTENYETIMGGKKRRNDQRTKNICKTEIKIVINTNYQYGFKNINELK